MFLAAMAVVVGIPATINFFNRALEELIIPNMEVEKIKRDREKQTAAGVPVEDQADFVEFKLDVVPVLTASELFKLDAIGALDIIGEGSKRAKRIKEAEEKLEKEAHDAQEAFAHRQNQKVTTC